MTVLSFILRRVAALTVVLLLVSFIVFSLLALSPGSPEQVLLGPDALSDPAAVAAIRRQYHLEDAFLLRYVHWLGDAVRLHFGNSTQSGEAVTHVIADRFEITFQLSICTVVVVLALGIPVGMLAAYRRGRPFDRAITSFAILAASAPAFVIGIVLIFVFGVQLGWFPPFGPGAGAVDRIRHLVLPTAALASGAMAIIIRQTRAAALDVMSRDYMVFARARGLGRRRILWNYALRNSALPVVTTAGLLLVLSLSGAVFVETVFGLPGLGSLLVESISSRNVPVVQGLTLFAAAIVVLANLLTDLLGLALDPRTRYGAGQ